MQRFATAIIKNSSLLLFPLDLDAPCMNLEGFFILKVIKNIEI